LRKIVKLVVRDIKNSRNILHCSIVIFSWFWGIVATQKYK